MANVTDYGYAIWHPTHKPYPSLRHEGLFAIARWFCTVAVTGDDQGGYALLEAHPYPNAFYEQLGLPRVLSFWWDCSQYSVYNSAWNGAQDIEVRLVSELVDQELSYANSYFRLQAVLADNANNLIHHNQNIDRFLGYVMEGGDDACIRATWSDNVDTRSYRLVAQGMIYMDEDQLIKYKKAKY